jgi:hypothetical protein
METSFYDLLMGLLHLTPAAVVDGVKAVIQNPDVRLMAWATMHAAGYFVVIMFAIWCLSAVFSKEAMARRKAVYRAPWRR